ncbi:MULTISPECIES: CS1-pili formation C-terminal domain-containing protein [unclassified Erwinia]|uniref:CS1-pili formation C-terminal domain-containing protein n=1 Tax=unclassified Erwinia TaxID=2622719 RepID=UPI0009EB9ED3|nr:MULTISPECIES: CS1-pili formation C-terminal domain-containing protein [unclassified Erwinia]
MKFTFAPWLFPFLALSPFVRAEVHPAPAHEASQYRFPAALWGMLKSGLDVPVLLENRPAGTDAAAPCNDTCYLQIGRASLFTDADRLGLRNVMIENNDSDVRLSPELLTLLGGDSDRKFDPQMKMTITPWAWFTLDVVRMRLILHVLQQGYGIRIKPRQYDIDDPTSQGLSSTLSYQFGGYSSRSARGMTSNSGYLNANALLSRGIDHLIVDSAMYVGNSFSSDRGGRINAALWERDYKGMRYAAGVLDSWKMQSVGNITALDGGEVYGFSVGNAASSRKREKSLSLTPVVVFFATAGEARIYREGKLIGIQRFDVGNHEIDTSQMPYGIYSVDVEVVSGGKVLSRSPFHINKPFSADITEDVRWQLWGGAYHRNNSWANNEDDIKTTYDRKRKEMLSLLGVSLGKSYRRLEWNLSTYMLKNQAIGELSLSARILSWFSLNTQGMSSSDGSKRTNVGSNVTLPWNAGNAWLNYSKLSTGRFLALYETQGVNWGLALNIPSVGFYNGGIVTFNEDRDTVYGYVRRRLDYSQSLYAGRYGTVRMRAGAASNTTRNRTTRHDRERFVMLDFAIPIGNAISVGLSHSRDAGTNLNMTASRQFDNDYLKSMSANLSKAFSGGVGRDLAGGVLANIDTPYNSNSLSVQTDNQRGWNTTLTSQGSLGLAGSHLGAGKEPGNAGVLIDTGLKGDAKLMLDVDGTARALTGNRNYIPLRAYNRYQLSLMNSAEDLDSYEVSSGAKNSVTLYPGNVVYLQPQVRKIVTVFGRLLDGQGQPLANRKIKNRFGLAESGSDGRFVIDVDTQHPVLNIETSDQSQCAIDLQIKPKTGAQWIGDVHCQPQQLALQPTHPSAGNRKS